MADFKSQQRVRLNNGTNDFGFAVTAPVFVTLSDGTNSVMDTVNDAVRVNIVAGSSSGAEFAEDSAAVSGDNGKVALVVRKDTIGSNVSTDGDYATLLQDANGRLYVQIHDGGNSITVDGTVSISGTVTVSATDLDIRDLTHVSDSVKIGDGTDFLAVAADGSIAVTDNGASLTVDNSTLSVVGGGTEATALRVTIANDSTGLLSVDDNGGSLTIDNSTLAVVGGGTEATALRVTIATDSTGVLSIDDNGGSITVDGTVSISGTVTVASTDLDIRDLNLTQDAIKVSGNASANSELNPIFVQNVTTAVSGEEIHNYDTSSAIAADATDNHDYTVAGTTFLLKSIIVAASGAMKCEIQTGPVASLTTKAVIFTSSSNPTMQINFNPPIEVPVTSTGTVRVIRRNDDNQAMDVYSTIIGSDI